MSEYPHTCPRCGSAAYVGAYAVKCSRYGCAHYESKPTAFTVSWPTDSADMVKYIERLKADAYAHAGITPSSKIDYLRELADMDTSNGVDLDPDDCAYLDDDGDGA